MNSYKRLVPGYEAPVYCAWSQRNRSALVRVPVYHPGKEHATRCELRCPDPSCNPYLTFAAMLHAGLEGIEKGYEIPDPMERNLYDLTHGERDEAGIEQLPETLGEAIEVLAESDLVRKALGDHIFQRYVELKREEWEEYRIQVSSGSWSGTCRCSRAEAMSETKRGPFGRPLRVHSATCGACTSSASSCTTSSPLRRCRVR